MSYWDDAQSRPRACWKDYISWLTWECLGVPLEELEEMAGLVTTQDKWKKMDRWIFMYTALLFFTPDCNALI